MPTASVLGVLPTAHVTVPMPTPSRRSASLGAGPGAEIEIVAEGPDAAAAVAALERLVADRFDEEK